MDYKQIMTPFFEAPSAERSFLSALTLAKVFKAHIDVMHMRQRVSITTGPHVNYHMAWAPDEYQLIEERNDKRAADFEALLGKLCAENSVTLCGRADHTEAHGATASWREGTGYLPDDIIANARLADLIVIARPDDKTSNYENGFAEEFIFQSGRPVIVADVIEKIPQTIMVAWDGSREAARALSAALPMLQKAEQVYVTSVGKSDTTVESPQDAAEHLRLHGVHAKALYINSEKGNSDEEAFLAHAEQKGADLIVMGGYSHSRWREIILGGFTRHLLHHSKIPLLLAH